MFCIVMVFDFRIKIKSKLFFFFHQFIPLKKNEVWSLRIMIDKSDSFTYFFYFLKKSVLLDMKNIFFYEA